ncbi:ABSCISIC ACID-INSENSITIVE 5-like protein 2 [Ranunculus cassubicifolius]
MGIQTMGSHSDNAHQQEQQFLSLSRQNSYYNLTLDEVENQLGLGGLGKPLGSMNLDELLKNITTADENDASAATSALQQQPSLSKKTVEELWRDIQRGQDKSDRENKAHDRQPTLGEMTLEDFLVKAGVGSQNSDENNKAALDAAGADLMISTPQVQWLQYQLPPVQHQPQPQENMMGVYMAAHPVPQSLAPTAMDTSYPENQMAISSPLMGTLSDTQTPGRKRGASGDMIQKTVERRQKRMIKNRESAARSRARKQAYTNELENKVNRLEAENALLKKQKHINKLDTLPLPTRKWHTVSFSKVPRGNLE